MSQLRYCSLCLRDEGASVRDGDAPGHRDEATGNVIPCTQLHTRPALAPAVHSRRPPWPSAPPVPMRRPPPQPRRGHGSFGNPSRPVVLALLSPEATGSPRPVGDEHQR